MDKTVIAVQIPVRLKQAAMAEAQRRGLTLSGLIKGYLANFLPEEIEKSIKEGEGD